MTTNARYVYWLACSDPRFGAQILRDAPKALRSRGFSLSDKEMSILDRFLSHSYKVTGREMINDICNFKTWKPRAGKPEVPSPAADKTLGTKPPPPPPPPWG